MLFEGGFPTDLATRVDTTRAQTDVLSGWTHTGTRLNQQGGQNHLHEVTWLWSARELFHLDTWAGGD